MDFVSKRVNLLGGGWKRLHQRRPVRARSNLSFLLALLLGCAASAIVRAAAEAPAWEKVTLLSARDVELTGALDEALRKGVRRLALEPYDAEWLLADVSFKTSRIFTNYSGDASGRFLELAALTTPRGQLEPPALKQIIDSIGQYQKEDGHFGLPMDLSKPLPKLAPPIPMLWGNARLLAALVTAAAETGNTNLLSVARRLGEFYVSSAGDLCSPAREQEYRDSGTYGDGYTCCYFPAMEGLAMLYRATRDARYLGQARRMAASFEKFDAFAGGHSHGNLCSWRGILALYDVTGETAYLDRARAKWEAAMKGGYIWPLGGAGERWNVFFEGDEGCTLSDWLRLNLELWRFTGQTRYLDIAERLLHNQYPANQCPNGGYGMRHYDGDASGPIGTRGGVDEWPFCCSFHGPLGLHYLKSYLASGSATGVFVNLPLSFRALVKAVGRDWTLDVQTTLDAATGLGAVQIDLKPATPGAASRVPVWVRVPPWATKARLATARGHGAAMRDRPGYLRVDHDTQVGDKIIVTFRRQPTVQNRRFEGLEARPLDTNRLSDVSILWGPQVLFAVPGAGSTNSAAAGRLTLLARMGTEGQLDFLAKSSGAFWTVALPGPNPSPEEMAKALDSGAPLALRAWPDLHTSGRATFMHNLVVLPERAVPADALARFAERAQRPP